MAKVHFSESVILKDLFKFLSNFNIVFILLNKVSHHFYYDFKNFKI